MRFSDFELNFEELKKDFEGLDIFNCFQCIWQIPPNGRHYFHYQHDKAIYSDNE